MAVTSARDNEKFDKKVKVGTSGGPTPEGYSTSFVGGGVGVGEEGVVTRGAEGDAKRFAEADKFMKSLKQADKLDPAKVAEAKAEKNEKEAESKPTAPGANAAALDAGKGQSPKETEKAEKVEVAVAKGEDPKKVK